MEKLKYIIAKTIGDNFCYGNNPTYEQLLVAICDNYYRAIAKIPVDMFMVGIVQHFIIKDVAHANIVLEALKDVVRESLESCGVELTYTDGDWLDLKMIENPERWGGKYVLSKRDKKYMVEFFET